MIILGPQVRKLYLYSVADRMVNSEDVQSHIKAARELGYQVGSVLFKHAQHCALMIEDEPKYWAAIERFWQGDSLSDNGISPGPRLPRGKMCLARTTFQAIAKVKL